MTNPVRQQVQAKTTSDGAGVRIMRSIGSTELRNIDPFLMLDYFGSDSADDYIGGFPDHPHRGFVTFTYMLDGHMLHKDSMGNEGHLRPGGIQWMKAASGVIHSEMPQQDKGKMRGFQLWINLPAAEKMSSPQYQEFSSDRIPVVKRDGVRVHVLMGEYSGQTGPVVDTHTKVEYFDVELTSDGSLNYTIDRNRNGFIYVFEGNISIGDQEAVTHSLSELEPGVKMHIKSTNGDARFIIVNGQPINETVVQEGPFVMNTKAEIHKAFDDYRHGRLVRSNARSE